MVTIFYDSLCPVCLTEVKFLKQFNQDGSVAFVDITEAGFAPGAYDRNIEDFIGTIHGITEEGELITGMPVFRSVYRALGLGWMMNWTGWPGLKPVVDRAYKLFCRIRPKLSKFENCGDRCRI
ncbi:MAG: DUF393 domain-containing protein [Pseudobacteriovorax sp.]|nr:DUF393 domain-containing protein [Pseudobacteriovorax sp.]